MSTASRDDSSTKSGRSRRRGRRRMDTIYENDGFSVNLESRNCQRLGFILLLSMIAFFGLEGIDFTPNLGRRQDTAKAMNHDDSKKTSWTVELDEMDSPKLIKKHSLFRPPKGKSLNYFARLEDIPGKEDLENEFDSISPIRTVLNITLLTSKNQVKSISLLNDVVTEEQHQDVLLAIQSILPPPEASILLERQWLAYQSFFANPASMVLNRHRGRTIPTFWHIPKTGGSTIKAILGNCHYKIMASEVGVLDGHEFDEKIDLLHIQGQIEHTRHVNVDVTTIYGLQRATDLGLVNAKLVDVISTPLIWDAAQLFQSTKIRGKVFSLFRDPISRAVSMFAYLQGATHERTFQDHFSNLTLGQYSVSSLVEDNFMTRQLCNTPPNTLLNKGHLEQAKAILSQKVLVGLLDRLEESLERFERFFGWTYTMNPTHQETCRNSLLANGVNMNASPKNVLPHKGSVVYNALAERNRLDLELFEFVVALYRHQASYVQNIPLEVRFINSTCSMCHDGSSWR